MNKLRTIVKISAQKSYQNFFPAFNLVVFADNFRFMKSFFACSFFACIVALLFVSHISAVTGSLDSTFGTNGAATVFINGADEARDTVVQPDGKIIVAGISSTNTNRDFSLCRLNADGSIDNSFGTNGKVLTPIESFDSIDNAWAVALQIDGKIVVAGDYSNGSGSRIALVRYNSDGSLDTSFDGDGKVTAAVGRISSISDVAVQSNGKIVIVGTFISNSGTGDFITVRFNSDGSLDTNFDGDGIVITTVTSSGDQAYTVALQTDGKIVVGGYAAIGINTSGFALVRYNSDGSLDTTFGDQGKVIKAITNPEAQDRIYSIVVQPNGKIVGAGISLGSSINSALARFNPDGSLDNSFGVGGKVITSVSPRDDLISDITLQSDGKLVVSGYHWGNETYYDFFAGRYNSDGTSDSSFGIGGFAFTAFSTGEERANAVALQPDGKIITVGNGAGGFIILRYPANGFRFANFDGDGKSDISVFRPENRVWYLQQSANGFGVVSFGLPTDKIIPADYDGDDKTDIATFRDGNWYMLRSTAGFLAVYFGQAGDIPQPSDFDGDGRAELAVFRPSVGTWYVLNLVNNQFNAVQFGASADKPVIGDYDGDGRADYAVYRPLTGTWYWINSSTRRFTGIQFGVSTDQLVPADYDGDGKIDLAVYREGVWYFLQSTKGFTALQFGVATDKPTPADYDGDGRADAAVFRNGIWHVLQSTAGYSEIEFGVETDKPIPNAFVR